MKKQNNPKHPYISTTTWEKKKSLGFILANVHHNEESTRIMLHIRELF